MNKILIRYLAIIALILGIVSVDYIYTKKMNKPLISLGTQHNENITIQKGLIFNYIKCDLCNEGKAVVQGKGYECLNIHEKRANLTLVGDLLFEEPYYQDLRLGTSKELYFNQILPYFKNDDLTLANMEVPISDGTLEESGVGYSFCAPQWVGEMVASSGFDVLSTANNHSYDRGVKGIHTTLDFFENNSEILTVGTYRNEEERQQPKIKEVQGIKFGFLSYTYETNVDVEKDEAYLVGYYNDPFIYRPTETSKELVRNEVRELRKLCDVCIVFMHWGSEFTFEPNSEQYEFAELLNEEKVDIIVGSHSHNIQPIDIIGDDYQTLVYYSLGNFVSADEDLDRTYDDETFDNAYQIGMLSNLDVVVDSENKIRFENVNTEMIVNYFDEEARNFELIPFDNYTQEKAQTHYRYDLGLTIDFIKEMHEDVVDEKYRN